MYRNSTKPSINPSNSPPRNKSAYSHRDNDESDVEQIISETKNVRNESVLATRDALARLRRTEDSAQRTLETLDTQSDKLHRAKTDLDVAKAEHRVANEQIEELKRLNKWFSFKNPFKSTKAERKLHDAKNRSKIEERIRDDDETRASRQAARRRHDQTVRIASRVDAHNPNSDHRFDSDILDDEDRKAEAEIDANLDEISNMTSRLKIMAQGISAEVDSQNKLIDRLGKNADEMNVRVGLSSHRVQKY